MAGRAGVPWGEGFLDGETGSGKTCFCGRPAVTSYRLEGGGLPGGTTYVCAEHRPRYYGPPEAAPQRLLETLRAVHGAAAAVDRKSPYVAGMGPDGYWEGGMPDGETGTADQAYRERNSAALLAARLAERVGWPVYLDDADPEWPLLYIESPAGQLSWHLAAADVVGGWPPPPAGHRWDGHTTEERIGRERDLVIYGKERTMADSIRQRKEHALGLAPEDASERAATPPPASSDAPPRQIQRPAPPSRAKRPVGARRMEPK